ncbi:MAG: adenosylmethionine--8-amino-7-oxononanoate transaminase [Pseudomonadota bacterium]|nr:adenosylmethionine--8-amino-7-oxononanoate transaminase [Pseudomonadota bacterium]
METNNPQPEHLWLPYTQMQTEISPLIAIETKGAKIRIQDGRWLIDGVSSWWTACHGYNHPHIMSAVQKQLEIMPHIMFGGFVHTPALELSKRLSAILPGAGTNEELTHIFFADSGSVAVEIALKMAVQYWHNKGETNRKHFITFRHSYHGDTLGAMSVCDPEESMHAVFKSMLLEQIFSEIPKTETQFANFEKLIFEQKNKIAGLVIEPLVQAAGGMKFHKPEVLSRLRRICSHHHLLFIADEIATGFGRTGAMFACEEAKISPDIICIGKALTGGVISMAAVGANSSVFKAFLSEDENQSFMHGPTYMANPLACAAANASLDLFKDGTRLKQVSKIEEQLTKQLAPCREIYGIMDVRVKGAIGVIQIKPSNDIQWLRRNFIKEGVWVRPFNDIVYVMPPFIISYEELSTLSSTVIKVLRKWSQKSRQKLKSKALNL